MKIRKFYIILFVSVLSSGLFQSCNRGPKVIESNVSNDPSETGIFSLKNKALAQEVSPDIHTVKVLEVLPTSKYVYLRVEEKGNEFWIATGKKEVNVGDSFMYRGGLLKKNFESKEFNRVFDEVYLVTSIVKADHGNEQVIAQPKDEEKSQENSTSNGKRSIVKEGSMSIKDLVDNASSYEGKTVQISGECVKVNPNIMDRNWIHLKDGSNDDYDLVVTTDAQIPEGHVVTMSAKVSLNKDFGAGYRYELILEEGKLVR